MASLNLIELNKYYPNGIHAVKDMTLKNNVLYLHMSIFENEKNTGTVEVKDIKVHDKVKVEFEADNLHLFDRETEEALFYEE